MSSRVLHVLRCPPRRTVHLVGFPYAGGSPTAFARWPGRVPDTWQVSAVCLPGRHARFAESWPVSLDAAVSEIAERLHSEPDGPLVFVGHSLGAIIAFEVAVRVHPELLAVAACAPPTPARLAQVDTSFVNAREFVASSVASMAIPDGTVADDLIEIAAETFIRDLRLLDGHRVSEKRVDCDIVAFYGNEDDVEPEPWVDFCAGRACAQVVPGDHFFVEGQPQPLISELETRLAGNSRVPLDRG